MSSESFSQVGGHENTFQKVGLFKIRKTTTAKEAAFYKELQSNVELKLLLEFTSKFYSAIQFSTQGKCNWFITIENVIESFSSPNILDLKLGSQLYDAEADELKKLRMLEKSKKTTSGAISLRIAGVKYFGNEALDKEFGRKLTVKQFCSELRKFVDPVRSEILKNVTELTSIIENIEARLVSTSILIAYEINFPRKYIFKLIDFAHSNLTPGQGPHVDLIVGLKNLVQILSDENLDLSTLQKY
eukprot:NODE_3_length_80033_cov_0.932970.p40 type:complete len:244 gc:universal NODE_3_length_80033_cov_0.932970:24316-25047(+)